MVAKPNNNLKYLLFGIGYQDPSKINENAPTTIGGKPLTEIHPTEPGSVPWGTILPAVLNPTPVQNLTLATEIVNAVIPPAIKPSYDENDHPYVIIDGKTHTVEDTYASLLTTGGLPQVPAGFPSGYDPDKSRHDLGKATPSASDGSQLTFDPSKAQHGDPYYPTSIYASDARQGNTLSLADQQYVAQHKALFDSVYGNKVLAHSDIQQVWVAKYRAVAPNLGIYGGHGEAKVDIAKWMNMNEAQRAKMDADYDKNAKKWAAKVGTGTPLTEKPVQQPGVFSEMFTALTKGPRTTPVPQPAQTVPVIQPDPSRPWLID